MQLLSVPVIYLLVIVAYQRHIQEELHIMLVRTPRHGEVVVRISPLARLLLQQHLEVKLQVVHTPLQAQHFRKERRFDKSFLRVEAIQGSGQDLVQGMLYVFLLRLRVDVEIPADICRQQAHGIVFKEEPRALGVGMCAGQLVYRFVKQLPSQISQHGRLCRG